MSPITATQVSGEQENPYAPPGPEPVVFDKFEGIWTSTTRPGVEDKNMWWCDGFMPIGPQFLRTLPGKGPALWSGPGNSSIAFFDFYNIGSTAYMVGFTADGAIYQINTTTGIVNQIAAAGTITSTVSRLHVGISQWGSQYLLIVSDQTNGYFIWNGSVLFKTGTIGVDTTFYNAGSGYTIAPTVTPYGGTGSGASLVASITGGVVTSISVVAAGSGYSSTDVVGLKFTGGNVGGNKTATFLTGLSGGSISTVSITDPGSGYSTAVLASIVGGGGFGASISLTPVSGTIATASIVRAGQDFITSPTILAIDAQNGVAQASVDVMPVGISGTAVETYAGRVWIANGPRVSFSAPGSLVDFATSDGGGNFTSADSFLRVGYVALRQTNGFLYLIGDSSINYISGVNTSGSPPITTFTNQNADPEVGTPYPASVNVYNRNIIFTNSFGVQVSYGAAVTKVSEALDGFFNSVPNFDGLQLSSAKAIVFGKKIWMTLVAVVDQVTQQIKNKLCMWNGKQWWTSDQDMSLIFIQHQEINSQLTAFGTDGAAVYPLFQIPTNGFVKTVQTKLWESPGGYQFIKTNSRVWALAQFYNGLSPTFTVSVDNELGLGSGTATATFTAAQLTWTNNLGNPIVWTNNAGQDIFWLGPGTTVTAPEQIAQQGVLTGMTFTTSSSDMALISATLEEAVWAYRG